MALLIRGLHIEEIIIDADPEEEQAEPEPMQEAPKKTEPAKKTAPKKTATERKTIDKGKVGALYKAGWNVAKIADEMRCNQSSIYRVIKEMGL